jgi:tRNA pseudouridine13 synthase
MSVAAPPLPSLDPPLVTAALPGIGGRLRVRLDDFDVEEIPAYEPGGEGEHVWVWIEKRDLTTPMAAARLAAAAGVPERDVGWAGMKDRRAVTRQWLSLPHGADPAALERFEDAGLRVLRVTRHKNKLRTGHLAGNRFALVVRDVGDGAAARAGAILAALAGGAPNWYAEQRFGRDGDNAERGLALIRARGRGPGAPRQRRFLVSAFQSYLFNRWLIERLADGLIGEVLRGDLLQKRGSGGMFISTEPEVDRGRLAAGEVVVTGPMFGAAMRSPPDGSPAHAREAALLASLALGPADFHPLRNIAEGARRHATVLIGNPAVETVVEDGEPAVRVSFTLPPGAYATAILREIQKYTDDPSDSSTPDLD